MIYRAERTAIDTLDRIAEVARMIDIGCEDLMAATRVVSGGDTERMLCVIATRLRAMANELSRIVRSRGGKVVRAGDAERRTCTIILQKLRVRFGDSAVFDELEGYCRRIIPVMDDALATAADDVELHGALVRYRDTTVVVTATLRAL